MFAFAFIVFCQDGAEEGQELTMVMNSLHIYKERLCPFFSNFKVPHFLFYCYLRWYSNGVLIRQACHLKFTSFPCELPFAASPSRNPIFYANSQDKRTRWTTKNIKESKGLQWKVMNGPRSLIALKVQLCAETHPLVEQFLQNTERKKKQEGSKK